MSSINGPLDGPRGVAKGGQGEAHAPPSLFLAPPSKIPDNTVKLSLILSLPCCEYLHMYLPKYGY